MTMYTDDELREIFANAPVEKGRFEVVKIDAPWFSEPYYVQNTFTEGVTVTLEDDNDVFATYAPMIIGESSNNADMTYERNVTIQELNDIVALEIDRRPSGSKDKVRLEFRTYVMYRDGTVSDLKENVVRTQVNEISRNNKGSSLTTSSKPITRTRTGEVVTLQRVQMLRGFM